MSEDKSSQSSENQFSESSANSGKEGRSFGEIGSPAGKEASGDRGKFAVDESLKTLAETTPVTRPKSSTAPMELSREKAVATYFDPVYEKMRLIFVGILLVPVLLLCYSHASFKIVETWWNIDDYSHGFLIIPLVIYFLWIRLDTYPGTYKKIEWFGLIPLLMGCLARYVGSIFYMDALEQWSILLWILGVVWLMYGTRVFIWALPSLSFLIFLFPYPYRIEMLARQKLQEFAAEFGVFLLQAFGQSAINIKTTIHLGVHEIGVEGACSGIRFLISFFAISIGTMLFLRRPWWQNLCIFLGTIPIALFVNAMRITMTTLLIVHFSHWIEPLVTEGSTVGKVADQFAGYVAIGLAFLIFGVFIYYLTRVFRKVNLLASQSA